MAKSLELEDKELDVLYAALKELRSSFSTTCIRGSIDRRNGKKCQRITREEIGDIIGKIETTYFDL